MIQAQTSQHDRPGKGHAQQGVALIIMLTLLVMAALSFLLSDLNQASSGLLKQSSNTRLLAAAKKALIDNAISNTHEAAIDLGYYTLPCPDNNAQAFPAEGISQGACGALGVTTIGRLPWRSLGTAPFMDADGECFWYVLSGSHKRSQINTTGMMLNRDKNGLLRIFNGSGETVVGNNPEQRAIAAIISPGGALTGQNRTTLATFVDHCSGNYNAVNYLDTINGINNAIPSALADTVTQLVTTHDPHNPDTQFNDRIAWITRDDLADAFSRQKDYNTKITALLTETALCLVGYAGADNAGLYRLPWAAPLALADYRIIENYNDASGSHFGRIAFITDSSASDSGNDLPDTLIPAPGGGPPGGGPPGGGPVSGCVFSAEVDNYRNHWKDHLFVVIAEQHDPDQVGTPNCTGNCLKVDQTNDAVSNPTGDYAAIILFADRRLPGQVRNAPPPVSDPDTKQMLGNYLEGNNLTNFPDASGNGSYQHQIVTGGNDRMFCIDSATLIAGNPISNLCP